MMISSIDHLQSCGQREREREMSSRGPWRREEIEFTCLLACKQRNLFLPMINRTCGCCLQLELLGAVERLNELLGRAHSLELGGE